MTTQATGASSPAALPAQECAQATTTTAVRRAVVWVPDWPVVAAVAEGLLDPAVPAAVHDARGRIAVASAPARRVGVRRGMRRRTAQELCPELELLAGDETREARAFEPLVAAIEEVVAEVSVLRPGLLLLPARGPARHVGGEETLAEALVGAVAEHAECQVGIADGLLAALLAARAGVILPGGGSAGFLADHDVAALTWLETTSRGRSETEELIGLLRRLGLHSLGAFAALDPGDVAARFGAHGAIAHRLARGLEARPVASRRLEQDLVASAVLDPPAERADRAAFAARSLAEELADSLARRGATCGRLCVTARTEDGGELARTWTLDGAPTAAELTDRVRWQLEGWLSGRSGKPPSAPLIRLELLAQEVAAAGGAQDGLWGRRSDGEVRAARAAVRLQGLLGPDAVQVPVLQGGRDPRSMARLVAWGDEASPERPVEAPWPGSVPPPWPATVPAEPIVVELLDRAGQPVRVDARGHISAAPAVVVAPRPAPKAGPAEAALAELLPPGSHPVQSWAGPWHGSERWWTAQARRRAYLQAATRAPQASARRSILPLLLVLEAGVWRVEGIYD